MKSNRILFVKPFAGRGDDVAPPLGLIYVASYVRKIFGNDYDMKLIDMRIDSYNAEQFEELLNAYREHTVPYRPDIHGDSKQLKCRQGDNTVFHRQRNFSGSTDNDEMRSIVKNFVYAVLIKSFVKSA